VAARSLDQFEPKMLAAGGKAMPQPSVPHIVPLTLTQTAKLLYNKNILGGCNLFFTQGLSFLA
jgi:hypothetical protein